MALEIRKNEARFVTRKSGRQKLSEPEDIVKEMRALMSGGEPMTDDEIEEFYYKVKTFAELVLADYLRNNRYL